MGKGIVWRSVGVAGAAVLLLSACRPQLDGAWKVTAVCPPQSHFGAITINAQADVVEREKGLFVGTITNSLGERGQFVGRLDGDTMTAGTEWEGQLPTQSLLVLDRRTGSFKGMDSNGCSLDVVRP